MFSVWNYWGKKHNYKKKTTQNFFGGMDLRESKCAKLSGRKGSISALIYGVIMKSRRGVMGWEETFATGPEEEEPQFQPDEKSRAE